MPKAPRIFVVEDDESIRMLLEVALRSSGYTVSAFPNAADALAEMENTVPDAAVLDIMLDGMDGITALKLMRANARLAGVPVMMLTAKDSENDKIIGLDAGADDYMTKPFSVLELCARVRALLRRAAKPAAEDKLFTAGSLAVDVKRRAVTVDGEPVILTYKEFELLCYLLENRGVVLSRDQILTKIWDYNYSGETRTVDVHIRTLRQKLGDAGALIETVRGVGYRLAQD